MNDKKNYIKAQQAEYAKIYGRNGFSTGILNQAKWEYMWSDYLYYLRQYSEKNFILDVGCANGFVLRKLNKEGYKKLYGIDPIFDFANTTNDSLRFKKCKGENICYDDQMFNSVICFSVLQHVDNPKKVLLEINRVLKTGGLIFISVPLTIYLGNCLLNIKPKFFKTGFSKKRLEKLFYSISFDIIFSKFYDPNLFGFKYALQCLNYFFWKNDIQKIENFYKKMDLIAKHIPYSGSNVFYILQKKN